MFEMDDSEDNPVGSLFSNLTWTDPVTETPHQGDIEVWEFINLTPDAHPIHIHLVQFRMLNQQEFNLTLWRESACHFNDSSCFLGAPSPALAHQVGLKDTILAMPSSVTRVMMQWSAHNGGEFAFEVSSGPGYLWHCHILDHEDNDMMRPIRVMAEVVRPAATMSMGARRQFSASLRVSVLLLLVLM